jgi:NAD(P)-dependent dehydrogenase (short-subunit alcohol dehydrogenase family)
MQVDFRGKAAVVTGASRGVGRCVAMRLARAGASVAFGARRLEPLQSLETALRAEGRDVIGVAMDVAQHEDCGRLVAAALERWRRLDILVNCAGVSGPQKLIRDLTPGEFDEVLRTNLHSVYSMIHFASRPMIEARAGAIVNIGSITGKRPLELRTPYATSKMAVVGLTRTVAQELAPYGVRCNTISPGPIAGERVEEVVRASAAARGLPLEDVRKNYAAWSPMGEMVTEDEIADMVLFLCSDSARHMTGQDINMSAGAVMY